MCNSQWVGHIHLYKQEMRHYFAHKSINSLFGFAAEMLDYTYHNYKHKV